MKPQIARASLAVLSILYLPLYLFVLLVAFITSGDELIRQLGAWYSALAPLAYVGMVAAYVFGFAKRPMSRATMVAIHVVVAPAVVFSFLFLGILLPVFAILFWRFMTREQVPAAAVVLVALLVTPGAAAGQGNLGTAEDRTAVEDVMNRYVWAVDSLDADGYVAVFTEDAVIDSNGNISKGHAQIRKIVTDMIRRRDENKAKGLPAGNLYHAVFNVRITFPKPGEALHESYWQTLRRDTNGRMVVAAMGRSADRLVKRNGGWLIRSRTLTVFTD